MARHTDIGTFLKSRRARITPEQVRLLPGPGPRRVTGLRREEVAQLACISVDYYVRLEQGRTDGVSDEVLNAVAGALRLGTDERDHLLRLGKPHTRRHRDANQQVRPGLLQLLHAVRATPAFVLGRRTDVLAWNPMAAALITDFAELPTEERNLARLIVLDEKVGRLYPDREQAVRNMVGSLRFDSGRYPDDPLLIALVADLCTHSAEFRHHWNTHTVGRKRHGDKRLDHPLLGELHLAYESLRLPDDPDQLFIVYTAPPGSPSEAKLNNLL